METRPRLGLRTERHYTSRRYRSFFSTSTSSTWSKWSSCRHHSKSSRLAGCKNNGWMFLTRCELWQEASGELSVPRQTSTQERRSSRRYEVFSLFAATHGNPVAFGDCYNAFHQSPMLSDSAPVYVEQVLAAKVDPSKVWLCRTAFQGLKISHQAWGILSTKNINDMGFDQLISDPSAYVAKRAQRHLDSILDRWMTRSAPHQRSISCVTLGT